jgi:hypothetical protein
MWPNYYLLEARRLANERTANTELEQLIHEARLYRLAHPNTEPNAARRAGARLALAASRASLRLARTLDECIADGAGAPTGATPLG